jgi:hypothetical protein
VSVYFITCRDVNMVKIGYSDRVRSRFASVKVCCPIEAKLELMLPGGKDEERAIHALLKKDRVRGEWFWITETVQRFINNPPPPPREYPDLKEPYTNLSEHELLIRRLQKKRRAQGRSATEADLAYAKQLEAVREREMRAAEKERLSAHDKGKGKLAKLEARGDIHFPFRTLALEGS